MIIEIKDVSWDREQKRILSKLNWHVKHGEHWCILGLNGSGKTTLLNMINGYIWPTEGQVKVLGKTFGEYDLRELRKGIGWVSTALQQKLYGYETALRIVLSGKFASIGLYDGYKAADVDRAKELMTSLGCAHFMDRTYDTLSQGERQRVLIARALMAEPKLLILDEPCTGLDLFAREQLLGMISAIAEQTGGPTMIYVTHHVEEILPCFTKMLLMKDGNRFDTAGVEETEQLLTAPWLEQFFGIPIKVEVMNERVWLSLKEPIWK